MVLVFRLALEQSECQQRAGRPGTATTERTGAHHTPVPTNPLKGGHTVAQIKPLEDRILVQPLDAEQTTASGLVIPDTAKEKPQEGKVLAVGPGRFDDAGSSRIPLDVKVDDVVIYSKYGGTEIKYNGEEYLLLSARDVLAVVEK
jgi:chaperonin GroES